jgi:zinc protease
MKALLLTIFLLSGFISAAFGRQVPQGDMPLDKNVTIGKLQNGLAYYIRENKEPENRAELRLVINAGSVLEDDDQRGLAHFVEHMAFNGTKNFAKQELIEYLEFVGMRFGADLNAYTSFDETVYQLRVPTDSLEVLKRAFQILEEWAHRVRFEDDEIDKERGVVIEEWRLDRGANARMFDKQFPILVKDSRYAERLPIGTKENLESFPYKKVKRFYRDWYRPDLMAVIAVGDFDSEQVAKLIKKRFKNIPPAKNPRKREVVQVPDHDEMLFAVATDPEATQSVVRVYYKHPPEEEATHRAYRESIVSGLFNRMLNDRFGEIVQQPGAPFIVANSSKSSLVRTKSAYTLTALVQDNGIEAGLEAILLEAERVARYGFTQSELDRQKRELLRFIEKLYEERDKQNSKAFAEEFIRSFLTGESIPGIAYEFELHKKFLPEITLEEVNRMVRAWITDKNRVVMVNAPEKEGLTVPTEAQLRAVFGRMKQKKIEPYADDVADAPLLTEPPAPSPVVAGKKWPEIGVTEWQLANGVRVLLKATDFKEDEFLFTAYSPGGTSLASDTDYVAASTATSVVQGGGLGEFDAIQLQKQLAGKLVRVSPYINSLEEGLSGGGSPKDMETLFQLIYLQFTAPRKDSTAFLAFQSRIKAFLANRSSNPEAAFGDTVQVTLAQYHQRARPVSPAYFDEMDLNQSFAFYRDRFADASDFTFVFVGNFTEEKIKPLIETYLGGLPSIKRIEKWRDVGIRAPKGVITKSVKKGTAPKSLTRIVFTGPFEWRQQNRYDLQSMIEVVRFRLREALREDLGATYGVSVRAAPSHYPSSDYSISINFGSDPARVNELVFVVFEEIHRLQDDGPSEADVEKVQEIQRRERETALKQNRSWLRWLEFYDQHGEDLLQINAYNDLVDNLTAEAIQEAAKRYFDVKNYVQVSLFPEPN